MTRWGVSRSERLRRQGQLEMDWQAQQQERTDGAPAPLTDACPARLGSNHDYTMRNKRDGTYSCWFCAKPKPPK